MVRVLLSSVTLLAFFAAATVAQDKTAKTDKDKTTAKGEKGKNGHEATITKVDAKKGTITVKMKDKNGKNVEKTFTLTEDVRMLDDTGRAVAIDVFQSGNEIIVVEQEGKLREVRKHKGGSDSGAKEKASGR